MKLSSAFPHVVLKPVAVAAALLCHGALCAHSAINAATPTETMDWCPVPTRRLVSTA